MSNKESLKHIQRQSDKQQHRKSEFQTIRLFAVLGLLTVLFVFIVRLTQNGAYQLPQRIPTSTIGTEGKK